MVDEKKYRYQTEIQQMMYVFGEVQDALPEVTMLVEEIVQRHTVEMIAKAMAISRRRGARTISVDDVVFLIRHDRAKVNRLKDYLSWKDLRKNVKEDSTVDNDVADDDSPEAAGRTKKRVKFTWEYIKEFTDYLEDESDEEDSGNLEAYRDSLIRLKAADDVTRNMTQSEYMFYSECKAASFTHRKAKRFREWTCMSRYVDGKPNDDIIDVVGFLCYELVRKLTETALIVKSETSDLILQRSLRQAAIQQSIEHARALEAEKIAKMRRGIQPSAPLDSPPIRLGLLPLGEGLNPDDPADEAVAVQPVGSSQPKDADAMEVDEPEKLKGGAGSSKPPSSTSAGAKSPATGPAKGASEEKKPDAADTSSSPAAKGKEKKGSASAKDATDKKPVISKDGPIEKKSSGTGGASVKDSEKKIAKESKKSSAASKDEPPSKKGSASKDESKKSAGKDDKDPPASSKKTSSKDTKKGAAASKDEAKKSGSTSKDEGKELKKGQDGAKEDTKKGSSSKGLESTPIKKEAGRDDTKKVAMPKDEPKKGSEPAPPAAGSPAVNAPGSTLGAASSVPAANNPMRLPIRLGSGTFGAAGALPLGDSVAALAASSSSSATAAAAAGALGLGPGRANKPTPLSAVHIYEAYRRLQATNCHTRLFRGGSLRVKPRMF